jgi:predicted enzyme related to lactoylglutathione lyase
VDEYLEKIQQTGGKVLQKKTKVPGVGYMAYCKDTEGNVFGIMQQNSSEK